MPKTSLIIRAFNEERHIGKLLMGIRSQSVDDVEVILVDSGSTDRTIAIAEEAGARIIHIARNEFSFGRAINRGCEIATGDILVFASAHVYPLHEDWLAKLVAPFNDPQIVLAYGRQIGGATTRFSEHRVFEAWFPPISVARQQHNFCNNANCAIRRSAWLERRYDEVLTGLEDLAWAKQARQEGGQIAYAAEAVIAHVHEETWSQVRNRYRREAMALRQIEPSARFGILDFLWLTATNVWSDFRAAHRLKVLKREWRSILFFRFNQFFGTRLGHTTYGELDRELRNRFYYPPSSPPLQSGSETVDKRELNREIRYRAEG